MRKYEVDSVGLWEFVENGELIFEESDDFVLPLVIPTSIATPAAEDAATHHNTWVLECNSLCDDLLNN